MLAGATETDTCTTGSAVIDTTPLADALGCAILRAVTVIMRDGATVGAVYRPDEEILPVLELPPTIPFTTQFKRRLLVPDTDAVNCSVRPTRKVEDLGEIETLTKPNFP